MAACSRGDPSEVRSGRRMMNSYTVRVEAETAKILVFMIVSSHRSSSLGFSLSSASFYVEAVYMLFR